MNKPLDRDALARRIFDAAISYSDDNISDSLELLLDSAIGATEFLSDSASNAKKAVAEPSWDSVSCAVDLINKSIRICRILAEQIGRENAHLRAMVKAHGEGGAA